MVSICLCTHTLLLNNCGTSVSTEGTVLFVVGTGLKHRSIGVSEIEDVLGVMCLHHNGR